MNPLRHIVALPMRRDFDRAYENGQILLGAVVGTLAVLVGLALFGGTVVGEPLLHGP